jgi:hypothetical protein
MGAKYKRPDAHRFEVYRALGRLTNRQSLQKAARAGCKAVAGGLE